MVLTIGYSNVFYDMFALISCIECTCHRAIGICAAIFGSRRRASSRSVTSVFRHSNRVLLYTGLDSVQSYQFDYITPACDSRRRRLTGTPLRTHIWIQRDSIYLGYELLSVNRPSIRWTPGRRRLWTPLSRPMNALALNSLALTRPARLRATTKANGTCDA